MEQQNLINEFGHTMR